jgi:hypothetical protein
MAVLSLRRKRVAIFIEAYGKPEIVDAIEQNAFDLLAELLRANSGKLIMYDISRSFTMDETKIIPDNPPVMQ